MPVTDALYPGHSELFLLQRDRAKLRTVCDGWRSCIFWVRTGAHNNFKSDPLLPIQENIVRLLLSRGDYTTDKELLDAIYHIDRRWGDLPVYHALAQLWRQDPSREVRELAQRKLLIFERLAGLSENHLSASNSPEELR